MKMKQQLRLYKLALFTAASYAYRDEIIDTGMEPYYIGIMKEFPSKQHWIESKIQEWLEEAENLMKPNLFEDC